MYTENNNNSLNYLIDPIFTNINRLLVLSFKRIEENNVKKHYRDFSVDRTFEKTFSYGFLVSSV